ncbi:MAG TPA: EAL domain-containing protein [Solirubrobacteraceae bacterium]|nr:EAL domain-containing protein [Solirubrobacteraceae bacterium]
MTAARDGEQTMSVLLVEDDEDDVLLTRGLLHSIEGRRFDVDWARTLDDVIAHLERTTHDAYLVDYRLGAHTGLDVARAILARQRHIPVIMLTGMLDHDVDVRAAELGVADFLVKGHIDAVTLERSIRYAITHQHALRALAESEQRYALAMAGANDGLWDWDLRTDQLYVSARWKAMLGYASTELGSSPAEWLDRIHPDDAARVRQALAAHLDGRSAHFEIEHRVRARDRSYRWMLTRGLAVGGADGHAIRIAGSQTDITERKRTETQLQHDALHDGLTGLPNRVLFLDRLQHAMRRRARTGGADRTAVLFLDLDRFKLVNDSLGHLAGDRLLVEVARRLEQALRPGDTVARLGGDEFTVLLEALHDRTEAEQVADRMLGTLTEPFRVDDRDLYLSASIGIAMAAGDDSGAVIRDADAAMYRAKAEGKGRHAMFDARLHKAAVARLDVETRLRAGLAAGTADDAGVRVVYQPIVRAADLQLAGFEALARWQDAAGTLQPDQFIPIAEETGLIYRLGGLVLRDACRQLAEWRSQTPHDLTMSVNLSGRQLLDRAFADEVAAALADHALPPSALRLEITESEAGADPGAVCAALQTLYERIGVRARLDDFGTGASSLTFLRGFPGDALKIDRSFVAAMAIDAGVLKIVTAIIGLAHNLGLEVVAEGVETQMQIELLRGLGCDCLQGFLTGRPATADELKRVLTPSLAAIS